MHEFELYGASLFETVLAKRGTFWRLAQHWQRLCKSASELRFSAPSWEEFIRALQHQLKPDRDQILRYSLLRTGGGWASEPLGQITKVLSRDYENSQPQSVRLCIPQQRVACNDGFRLHKSGSRFFYQHLLAQAQATGLNDCLIVDQQEQVLETCYSNILWCRKGHWFTPHARLGLLPGIFRQWLLECEVIQEAEISLQGLLGSDGVLICNSVRGMQPVEAIGQQSLDTEKSHQFQASLPRRVFTALGEA